MHETKEPMTVEGIWCHRECPFSTSTPPSDGPFAGSHCTLLGKELDFYDGFLAKCLEEK